MNHSVCKKHSPACLHWQRSNVLEPTRRRLYRSRHRIGLSVLNLITSLSSCTQLDSAQSWTIGIWQSARVHERKPKRVHNSQNMKDRMTSG
jgi:hypothetical protein